MRKSDNHSIAQNITGQGKMAAFLCAGSLVAVCATSCSHKKPVSDTSVGISEDASSFITERNIKPATPAESLPNPESSIGFPIKNLNDGVLIEKKMFGADRESVLYIPDYHDNSAFISDLQRSVQMEIFNIVESIVLERGKVPVAMEVWTIGDTADNYIFRTSDSQMLKKLFSQSTRESRLQMVPAVMENTRFAGPVIAGVFQEEVVPVGTVSERERLDANDLARTGKRLMSAVKGDTQFCTGTDGRNYSFYQARDAFRGGGSEVTDHCYCAVNAFEERFLERFGPRMTEVPVKEVSRAIEAPGNFSVVIAGLKHWPTAREELERRGVNYAAVAPKSLAAEIKEPPQAEKIEAYYPDSPDGRCEKLMRERRALVAAALKRI